MSNYIDQMNKHVHQNVNWVMEMAWNVECYEWSDEVTPHNEYLHRHTVTGQSMTSEEFDEFINQKLIDDEKYDPDDWEPVHVEVCTYFTVSDQFGYYLQSHGYATYDTPLGTVWGRETGGQHVALDTIMQDFAIDKLGFKKEDIKF